MKHTKVEVLDGAQNAESHLDTGGSEEAVNPVVKGLGGNPKCLSDDGDAVSKSQGKALLSTPWPVVSKRRKMTLASPTIVPLKLELNEWIETCGGPR